MGKLLAIGGGEFTRREIDKIDRYALDMTGKSAPRALYIPTASNDAELDLYDSYFKEFGVELDKLALIYSHPSNEEIEEKFDRADYIFAGGGDALLLMRVWCEYGLDSLIRKLYHHTDKVFSGISAGSICYFEIGHTDSLSYHHENWDYCRMHGTGLVPAIHSPHYNPHRHASLTRWISDEVLPGVGLNNCCALCCDGGKYSIVTSSPEARCHILRNTPDGVIEELYADGESIKL